MPPERRPRESAPPRSRRRSASLAGEGREAFSIPRHGTGPTTSDAVERKWQERWADEGTYEVDNDDPRPPFYALCMYPYPSGPAHQGHVRNYTFGDLVVRHQTMLGTGRALAARLRLVRAAGRERRHQDRHPPADVHRGPDRRAEGLAHPPRRGLRLAAGGPQPRPDVHPLEPGDLPAAARGRPGLPGQRPGQLVPGLPDGAGQRAGAGRRHLRALGRPGGEARPRAVVLPDHRLRRRAARAASTTSSGPSGSRPCSATGSAAPRAPSSTSWSGSRRRRRPGASGPPGVHHPPRHELRHDLRRAGARAPAGRRADHRRARGRPSTSCAAGPPARPRSSACRPPRAGRRSDKRGAFTGS